MPRLSPSLSPPCSPARRCRPGSFEHPHRTAWGRLRSGLVPPGRNAGTDCAVQTVSAQHQCPQIHYPQGLWSAGLGVARSPYHRRALTSSISRPCRAGEVWRCLFSRRSTARAGLRPGATCGSRAGCKNRNATSVITMKRRSHENSKMSECGMQNA